MDGKLGVVPYPRPVAETREQVVSRLLDELHVRTNLGLRDLEFGILLQDER